MAPELEPERLDIHRDRRIDYLNLHFEWELQCELAQRYGKAFADAKNRVERFEEQVKIREAQAYLEALKTVEKPVDKVKAVAALNPKFILAQNRLRLAKKQKGLMDAAFTSISSRKSALEGILNSYAKEMWAMSPSLPQDYDEWRVKKFAMELEELKRHDATQLALAAGEKVRAKRKRLT